MPRNGVLVTGMVVHLGQDFGAIFGGCCAKPVKDAEDFRFDQKAAAAKAFGGVAEGVETKNPDPALAQETDIFLADMDAGEIVRG